MRYCVVHVEYPDFYKVMNFKINKGIVGITALASLSLLGLLLGGGYFGVMQYKRYQAEKIEKENHAQVVVEAQQKALEDAKTEIEKLKIENESTKRSQQALEKTVKSGQQGTKETSISALELAPYLSGVVEIECKNARGSGSLWNLSGLGFTVLTNRHVIINPNDTGACTVRAKKSSDLSMNIGYLDIYPDNSLQWNNKTDVSLMKLIWKEFVICDENGLNCADRSKEIHKPIKDLNYSISALLKCPIKMPVGAPVAVIGFPAFAEQGFNLQNYGPGVTNLLTASNGIISAQDSTVIPPYGELPYVNYFVSAKIDSGNSGGIALAKTTQGLCVLGIPTWVSVGNYETNGVIQNIHNVMYKE